MQLAYTAGIRLYGLAIRVFALFNKKAQSWVKGRKDWEETFDPAHKNGIWMHCASAGEFEQGRPVIEALRREFPAIPITLTFFSPSGYELRKNYNAVNQVAYLPLDTPRNARKILDLVEPKILILVKYEVWHNLLRESATRKVDVVMISAIFRKEQVYFKPGGRWFAKSLRSMARIYCQNQTSAALLESVGIKRAEVAGDTRFDRVLEIAQNAPPLPEGLTNLCEGRFVLVAGSTWPKDEALLKHYSNRSDKDLLIIIAPHELHENHLDELESQWPNAIRMSRFATETNIKTLVIDRMGLLSSLYQLADIAYIGGGFGVGIHNTLEAAAFGVPIIFGPNYQKFQEAKDLVALGAGFSIANENELFELFHEIGKNHAKREELGVRARNYVVGKAGSTKKIMAGLKLLLTD